MSPRTSSYFFWSLALGLVLAGCNCGPAEVACFGDNDCAPGEVCRLNACVAGGEEPDGGEGGALPDGGCALVCDGECCPPGHHCEADGCRLDCTGEQTRCGPKGAEACCGTEQLCYLDACVTPGSVCVGHADCGPDDYCDPTVGRCLPRVEGSLCEFVPTGNFEPELMWRSPPPADNYTQVMMTPVVIDVNADGTPDVLANYFSVSGGYNGAGVMRAHDGATGTVLWTSADVADARVHPPASIAAADLEGEGAITAVTVAEDGRLAAYDGATGALVWKGRDGSGDAVTCNANWGGPAIADLDGDGVAEIVCGLSAYDADGVRLWSAGLGAGAVGPLTVVADLDGDGAPDITDGQSAYRHDGTPLGWTGTGFAGLAAVGDFVTATGEPGRDGLPELVVVGAGQVSLVNGQTGAQWTAPQPLPSGAACVVGGGTTGTGGPPTIADFDGDGAPEVGVANLACYTVFKLRADGSAFDVLWSKTVQDRSSSVTGSSVFDFDGDGRAEVVYADELAVHVFDGASGDNVLRMDHCSGTTYEYPVIVDVDGNGRANIVVAENTYTAGGLGCAAGVAPGISVLRDANDQWVNTRALWNQHTYHVTNVCDGRDWVCGGPGAQGNSYGRVPKSEPPSWSFANVAPGVSAPPLNSYRQNVQGEGLFNAPDLVPSDLRELTSGCRSQHGLSVRVLNQGALGVLAGLPVAFYEDTVPRRLLAVGHTSQKLLPGQSEVVTVTWTPEPEQVWPITVVAVVDDDGTGAGSSSECVEDNNTTAPLVAYCGAIG